MQTVDRPMRDDVTLLKLIKKGDHAAFAELYQRWKGPLFGMAVKLLHQPDDAKDLVQETFIKLWLVRDSISDNPSMGYIKTFLYRGCYDLTYRRQLEQRYKAKYLTQAHDEFTSNTFDNKELKEIIVEALQLLPEKMRAVCEMAFIHHLSAKEMAELMNISVQSIRNQLVIGRDKLQTYILRRLNFEAVPSLPQPAPNVKFAAAPPPPQPTWNVKTDKKVRKEISTFIDGLPPKMQKALKMWMNDNIDTKEIARELHVSEVTIRQYISRGKSGIRKQLTGGKKKRF